MTEDEAAKTKAILNKWIRRLDQIDPKRMQAAREKVGIANGKGQ